MTRNGILARLEDRPAAPIMALLCGGWVATFPYTRNPGPPLNGLVDLVGRPVTVAILAALCAGWTAVFVLAGNSSRRSVFRINVAIASASWWVFVTWEFIVARGWDSPAWVNTAIFALVSAAVVAVERRRWAIVRLAEKEIDRWKNSQQPS